MRSEANRISNNGANADSTFAKTGFKPKTKEADVSNHEDVAPDGGKVMETRELRFHHQPPSIFVHKAQISFR